MKRDNILIRKYPNGEKFLEETKKKRSISLNNFFKENLVWNKGLTKETDERVNSISKTLKETYKNRPDLIELRRNNKNIFKVKEY